MARALKPPSLKKIPIKLPARLPSRPQLPDPNEPDVVRGDDAPRAHGGAAGPDRQERDRDWRRVHRRHLPGRPTPEAAADRSQRHGGFDVVSPTDPITLYFKIALYIAIGIALPVLLWQLVGFLVPGLTKKEKRLLYLSMPFVVLLFLLGVAYGFFFAAPRASDVPLRLHVRPLRVDARRQEVITFYPDPDAWSGSGVPVAGRHVHPGQARRGQPGEDALLPQIRHPDPAHPVRGHHAVDRPFNMAIVFVPL